MKGGGVGIALIIYMIFIGLVFSGLLGLVGSFVVDDVQIFLGYKSL
jgi:hypothetical protein